MAKFNFKLQSLLNIRMQQEENLKNELGKAIRILEAEKAGLLRLETEMHSYIDEFNEKAGSRITVEKLREYNIYISFLSEKIKSQKENVNYAQKNVDKVREDLLEAAKNREILDRLKEKKFEEFLGEQSKEEQRINDEVVSFKYTDKLTGE